MDSREWEVYRERDAVLLSREVSRGILECRDELGQVVELDGLLEEKEGEWGKVRVLQVEGERWQRLAVIGLLVHVHRDDLSRYEGLNVWHPHRVRRILRRRRGEDDGPVESPYWSAL